jgi:UDP-N-acetylmuramate dehydrogenase
MSLTTARALRTLLGQAHRRELEALFSGRVSFDEPLAPHTSWKIGGPADALVQVESDAELSALMHFCFKRKLPWLVIGSGSNLLVGDGGVRGIVIRLGAAFAKIAVQEQNGEVVVDAGASAAMAAVTARAASAGGVAIGSLSGIPGTVGGSLRMNAGTDRELGDFVRSVWVVSPVNPQPHPVTVQYFYRHSSLARDAIVARVTLAFAKSDPRSVRDEMQGRLVRRKRTQPVALPNAGSCFRNPPGDSAARLIESVGAKGWREGGAEVSRLHANFINNVDRATAKDVATLLARVRRAVRDALGVELQLEVHLVGVFVDRET